MVAFLTDSINFIPRLFLDCRVLCNFIVLENVILIFEFLKFYFWKNTKGKYCIRISKLIYLLINIFSSINNKDYWKINILEILSYLKIWILVLFGCIHVNWFNVNYDLQVVALQTIHNSIGDFVCLFVSGRRFVIEAT